MKNAQNGQYDLPYAYFEHNNNMNKNTFASDLLPRYSTGSELYKTIKDYVVNE